MTSTWDRAILLLATLAFGLVSGHARATTTQAPHAERYRRHLEAGRLAADRDDLMTAERELRAALELRETVELHTLLGHVLLRQGGTGQAAREFKRAMEIDPRSSTAVEGMGRVLMAMGRHEEGRRALRRATELDPCNWRAFFHLGLTQMSAKRWPMAAAQFRQATQAIPYGDPMVPRVFFHLGLALNSMGKDFLAAHAYRQSLASDPHFSDSANNLAVIYIDTDQFREAQQLLEAQVERDPANAQLHYLLGVAYHLDAQAKKSGNVDTSRAFNHLDLARKLNYQGEGLDQALGWAALNQRQYELAQECFERLLRSGRNDYAAHEGLGYTHLRNHQLDQARQHLDQALKAKPDDARLLAGLATVASDDGRLEEALRLYDRAIAANPDYADAVYRKGMALMKLGRRDEAKKVLDQFAQLERSEEERKVRDRDVHERILKAQDLDESGRVDEAIALLREAVKAHPEAKLAQLNLGLLLVRLGRSREALGPLRQSVRIDPKLAAGHALLAEAYTALGDKKAADRARELARTSRYTKDAARGGGDAGAAAAGAAR